MASIIIISFSDTTVNPVFIMRPIIIRLAPAVSIIEAACILVKTSGILIKPIAPITGAGWTR